MQSYDFKSEFNEKWGGVTKKIIRMLSENSRISITEMAKQLGVSRRTVESKMRKAEEDLGIKYTLELDERKLGLNNPHLTLIKFTEKPDYNKVKAVFENSHIPQLVARVSGTYDLFVYANAEDPNEYVYWDKTTQVLLSEYKVIWQPSDLAFGHLGFVPIRSVLIERLKVPDIYKRILHLLNENSRLSFKEMAIELKMKPNTLAYTFNKLVKSGYIKRFTIVLETPKNVSMMSLFGKYVISKGFEDDSMSMRREVTFVDDKTPLISRCLFSAQLIGSFDFFFVGAYDNSTVAYEKLVKYYRSRFKRHKVKVMYGTIDDILIGSFPTRNLNVVNEFNMIRWVPGKRPQVEKPG